MEFGVLYGVVLMFGVEFGRGGNVANYVGEKRSRVWCVFSDDVDVFVELNVGEYGVVVFG